MFSPSSSNNQKDQRPSPPTPAFRGPAFFPFVLELEATREMGCQTCPSPPSPPPCSPHRPPASPFPQAFSGSWMGLRCTGKKSEVQICGLYLYRLPQVPASLPGVDSRLETKGISGSPPLSAHSPHVPFQASRRRRPMPACCPLGHPILLPPETPVDPYSGASDDKGTTGGPGETGGL